MAVAGKQGKVCFPAGHVCTDPHGIGDGKPVETDCFHGSGRACIPSCDNWPACTGGTFTPAAE